MSPETFLEILKYAATSPAGAILAILLYDHFVRNKRNGGGITKAMLEQWVKDLMSHGDRERTAGFLQMGKDLSTTIQKETENAMTKALFNMWQSRGRK